MWTSCLMQSPEKTCPHKESPVLLVSAVSFHFKVTIVLTQDPLTVSTFSVAFNCMVFISVHPHKIWSVLPDNTLRWSHHSSMLSPFHTCDYNWAISMTTEQIPSTDENPKAWLTALEAFLFCLFGRTQFNSNDINVQHHFCNNFEQFYTI